MREEKDSVTEVRTKVIKRNGMEVVFNIDKIINAIDKANREVDDIHRMNRAQIVAVAETIAKKVAASYHAVNVEDIQNMVETGIMEMRAYEVAQRLSQRRWLLHITP
jgi:anaerobic ribonucleoside-triphosphate reductase